jgi:glutamine synthetase
MVDIVRQDRGAALRICPVFASTDVEATARQFNIEFRVADAAASPYMALGAVLFAGADGLRRGLALPAEGAKPPPLPGSLAAALKEMETSKAVQDWFGPVFLEAYLRHKRAELGHTNEFSASELCHRYAEVY